LHLEGHPQSSISNFYCCAKSVSKSRCSKSVRSYCPIYSTLKRNRRKGSSSCDQTHMIENLYSFVFEVSVTRFCCWYTESFQSFLLRPYCVSILSKTQIQKIAEFSVKGGSDTTNATCTINSILVLKSTSAHNHITELQNDEINTFNRSIRAWSEERELKTASLNYLH